MTTTNVGITRHAAERLRERIDALRTASIGQLKHAAEQMLRTAQPYGPSINPTRRKLCVEYEGEHAVLVVHEHTGHHSGLRTLIIVTCMTIEQAKQRKREKSGRRGPARRARRGYAASARSGAMIRGGFRNAASDGEDDAR